MANSIKLFSPLAGEINWMETVKISYVFMCRDLFSPLAGEINWMETSRYISDSSLSIVSPLAGEINWMETFRFLITVESNIVSPLAGEINWMETSVHSKIVQLDSLAPHSLGKLIEWKHAQHLHALLLAEFWPPHSLGKLIEWKLGDSVCCCLSHLASPLAGEINWMETRIDEGL